MSAIAYYLERAGIATTGISLVRENTAALAPPRFLWVSFPLGRPLGNPDDPPFQHRVIAAALALLEAPAGPVLADFPEDAAAVIGDDAQPLSCPISFPPPPVAAAEDNVWQRRLTAEHALLAPWYARSLRRRGRTAVGLASRDVVDTLRLVARWLDHNELTAAAAARQVLAEKHAIEDAKTYYTEAMTAQPGGLDQREVQRMLWQETGLGAAIAAVAARLLALDPGRYAGVVRILLPRAARRGASDDGRNAD